MKTKRLRVLFVVDAMKGRNGVGAYFQDLSAHLRPLVERVELVAPSLSEPHPCQGVSMPIPGDATQRLFLPRMRRLAALVEEMRPHVIVIPGPGLFALGAFWIARRRGIPLCVTYQTDYHQLVRLYWGPRLARLAGGLIDALNRLLFRGSRTVTTICESMLAEARAAGARQPCLVGTPLGEAFVNRPPRPMAAALESVLYVGRLAAEKNIDAVLALAEHCPQLRVVIAGDGPLRDRVRERATALPNLDYLGWCSREQVVEAVDAAQVLVLPSTVEAFGTVALEAMARQRLVIATPACGINEWPQLARALTVIAPGESLADTVRRLAAHTPAQRQAQALAARAAAMAMNRGAVEHWARVLADCAGPEAPQPAAKVRSRKPLFRKALGRLGAASRPGL